MKCGEYSSYKDSYKHLNCGLSFQSNARSKFMGEIAICHECSCGLYFLADENYIFKEEVINIHDF